MELEEEGGRWGGWGGRGEAAAVAQQGSRLHNREGHCTAYEATEHDLAIIKILHIRHYTRFGTSGAN